MMDPVFLNKLKQSMRHCGRNDTVATIHSSMLEWLRGRDAPAGNGQLMPVSHLADALGVARQTVQKVYQLLEAEKLIYRQPNKRIWYMKHSRHSNLQNIALILPMMFSNYYLLSTEYGQRHFGVYSGIADRAMELGYALVPRQLPPPGASRPEILAAIDDICQHYSGVIHLGERHYDSDPPLAELVAQSDLPQIAIDCEFAQPWIGSVTFDPDKVAHTVSSYLRENGHRRIGIVYPHKRVKQKYPACSYIMIEQETVLKSFAESSMRFDKIFEIVSGASHSFGEDGGKQVFRTIKAPDAPTAFWCRGDLLAMRLIQILKKFGCSVPDDFSVLGFDNIPLAAISDPPLTTLQNPIYKLGYTAMTHLDRYIRLGLDSFPRVKRLAPELCIRKSVAARNPFQENIQLNSKEMEKIK